MHIPNAFLRRLILATSLLALIACDDGDGGATAVGGDGGEETDVGLGGDAVAGEGDAGAGAGGVVVPACNDTLDNDGDGLTDLDDPGCDSPEDEDEADGDAAAPECADGVDNDEDGKIDISDPDCNAEADPSESGNVAPPACYNEEDDDDDGLIDFPLDPGCRAAGDDDEVDPGTPAECNNGVDDDEDGLTDFPADPGCAGVGDLREADGTRAPACANGRDDNMNGATDWPDESGCYAAGDYTEFTTCGPTVNVTDISENPDVTANTADGGFGLNGSCGGEAGPELVFSFTLENAVETLVITTDHPETEAPTAVYVRRRCDGRELACDRGTDGSDGATVRLNRAQPGTYFIIVDTRAQVGGPVRLTVGAEQAPQCRDGMDNDDDGLTDLFDPGCTRSGDDDESDDPASPPDCADLADNDADGLRDYPEDPGCVAAGDDDESDPCGAAPVEEIVVPTEANIIREIPEGQSVVDGQECTFFDELGPEVIFTFELEQASAVVIRTRHPGTNVPTTISLRSNCLANASEVVCVRGGDGEAEAYGASASIQILEAGRYFLIVDRDDEGRPADAPAAKFEMSVEVTPLGAACSDGRDNDGDGRVDGEDRGCASADDDDEGGDVAGDIACSNGLDDDEDGATDHPEDPGCFGVGDDDEADPDPAPQCSNGIDDDGDGRVDFPADFGCHGRGDDIEADSPFMPACSDGIDNDADGFADIPEDPGCTAGGDLSERDPVVPSACNDLIDNDGDERIDYPADPGCVARGDNDETSPEVLPICANGMDDDVPPDGLIDWPEDPGCVSASYFNEIDPIPPPACANGEDDDGDGDADWPEDEGCLSAADDNEIDPLDCADREDNDEDGAIDLDDIGCENRFDNDETDPDEVPVCSNGEDDDEDGLVDYPEDEGCQAAGDTSEMLVCLLADGVVEVGQDGGDVMIDNTGLPSAYVGSCGGRGPEQVVALTLTDPSDVVLEVVDTDVDTIMHVRGQCDLEATEVACNDDGGEGNASRIVLEGQAAGTYFIFVDGFGENSVGAGTLRIEVTSLIGECNDEIDNDEDLLIDLADPGCTGDRDQSEMDPPEIPECFDGIDNDEDGDVDFPDDDGCVAAGDETERVLCMAGSPAIELPPLGGRVAVDTDGNAGVFGASCGAGAGSPEQVVVLPLRQPSRVTAEIVDGGFDSVLHVRTACDDADAELECDDDGGDGTLSLLEFEQLEPGNYFFIVDGFGANNSGPATLDVRVDPLVLLCEDALDNDGDGLIDAEDPGCLNALDNDERDPDVLPLCGNGEDDDGDGLVDLADLACDFAGQDREDQSCGEPAAIDFPEAGSVVVDTTGLEDRFETARCGGAGAGDALYRVVVGEAQAGLDLVASVANDGTAIDGASVSIRTICDLPLTEIGCGFGEGGTVRLPEVAQGEYYVIVDGVGISRIVSLDGDVDAPNGMGYRPDQRVVGPNLDGATAWLPDGQFGSTIGSITVTFDNLPTGVDITPGQRELDANGLPLRVTSDFADDNVLRVTLTPAGENAGPVFLQSFVVFDGEGNPSAGTLNVNGLEIPAAAIDDVPGAFADAPLVLVALVPSRAADLELVDYRIAGGVLQTRGLNIELPATFYFATGAVAAAPLADAIERDVFYPGEVEASEGEIELTVEFLEPGMGEGGAGGEGGMDAMGGAGGAGGAGGMDAMGGAGGMDAMGGAGGMDAMGGAGGMDAMGGAGGMEPMGGAGGAGMGGAGGAGMGGME